MSYRDLWLRRALEALTKLSEQGPWGPSILLPCPKGCLRVTSWRMSDGHVMSFAASSGRALCTFSTSDIPHILTVATTFHTIYTGPGQEPVSCRTCGAIVYCTPSLSGRFRLI